MRLGSIHSLPSPIFTLKPHLSDLCLEVFPVLKNRDEIYKSQFLVFLFCAFVTISLVFRLFLIVSQF